jgi:hypothetical protein
MILGVVDRVHTDGVNAKLLELSNIARAASRVGNGVLVGRGAAGLVVDTADVEAVALGGVESCGGVRSFSSNVLRSVRLLTIALDAHGRCVGVGDGVGSLLNNRTSESGREDACCGNERSLHYGVSLGSERRYGLTQAVKSEEKGPLVIKRSKRRTKGSKGRNLR